LRHSDPEVLAALDLAWDDEEGPLGKLRSGRFDPILAGRYIDLLNSIEISKGQALHPDFVRLVWFAPLFSEWQIERAVKRGSNERDVRDFCDMVRERMMEILGVP
jgi:hypothetical protein